MLPKEANGMDVRPGQEIQLTFDGMPSVEINVKISTNGEVIYNAIESGLEKILMESCQ